MWDDLSDFTQSRPVILHGVVFPEFAHLSPADPLSCGLSACIDRDAHVRVQEFGYERYALSLSLPLSQTLAHSTSNQK